MAKKGADLKIAIISKICDMHNNNVHRISDCMNLNYQMTRRKVKNFDRAIDERDPIALALNQSIAMIDEDSAWKILEILCHASSRATTEVS